MKIFAFSIFCLWISSDEKKLKPDISLAVNKKRLHTGWYTAMLFPACMNSRNCYDYRFLKCTIYSLWIMQNYGLFYLILLIWKHEHLSSYCLWKIILYALVYTFPLSILFFFVMCLTLFSITSLLTLRHVFPWQYWLKLLGMLPITLLFRPKESDGAICVLDTLGCLSSHN